jgi:hypothetical protein
LPDNAEPANQCYLAADNDRRLMRAERKLSMNASNRFAIETLAREQQAEIQRNLQRRMHHLELETTEQPARPRPGLRVTLIVAATTIVSTAVALGMSLAMSFGFAILR